MPCDPQMLRKVSLFALLDEEEAAVLAAQVEIGEFEPRHRFYRMGEAADKAYILISGSVEVTTVDEDQREVLVDRPSPGEFFGFASMMSQSAHQTSAVAMARTACVEVDRHDIFALLQQKPHAGMDMLSVLGRQFHASQNLVRGRTARNANEVIEEQETTGERLADGVARFGGSWAFILSFGAVLVVYTAINVMLGKGAWDPYPFILLNLFLSMLAAIQAPVIMMSQNRQDSKDRLRGELDFDVNRRAESQIQVLSRKMLLMEDKIDDILDAVGKSQ